MRGSRYVSNSAVDGALPSCPLTGPAVETGACQYCRTLGIPCEADPRSRKRPFYRVSGEVYEYTLKLLRRFVSEEELPELTVENIEALLQKLDSGEGSTTTLTEPSAAAPSNDASSELVHAGDLVGNDVMEADEHPLLQEELGCMLLDSKGKYRTCMLTPNPTNPAMGN